jgi:hypothetical protein
LIKLFDLDWVYNALEKAEFEEMLIVFEDKTKTNP